MNAPIDWLLCGEAWIAYRVRRDLLDQPDDHPQTQAARAAMLAYPAIRGLIEELTHWDEMPPVSAHKNAGLLLHKLVFLADIGIRADDPGMPAVLGQVMSHRSAEGIFTVPMDVSGHSALTGVHQAWALCDAPSIVYALTMMGLGSDPRVTAARNALKSLVRENGWPCAVSAELGNFRGPGRKQDPCPYATLLMLKALAQDPSAVNEAAIGIEILLDLWQNSREKHPYIFYMGDDFRKVKATFVWYDILHTAFVLSMFATAHEDPRFKDMMLQLGNKVDAEGKMTAESAWTPWKGWEFADKKNPSRWITCLYWIIRKQSEK